MTFRPHFFRTAAIALPTVLITLTAHGAPATAPELIKCDLTLAPTILDPRQGAKGAVAGSNLFLQRFDLIDGRPTSIAKEPAYVGKPRYGAFTVGNGPRNVTYFAIDEAKDFEGRIYVDKNQNGDLTDDGPGTWDQVYVNDQGRNCLTVVAVRASWGTALQEKESGEYSLWLTKLDGSQGGGLIRLTARTGMLKIGEKQYPIVVGENTGDGIYTVPADADLTRNPVTLYIDPEDPTRFDVAGPTTRGAPQKFNIAHPFQLDGRWYIARPSISGAMLTVQETTAPDQVAKAPSVAPEKLPVGSVAPDFKIEAVDGKPLSLADFKGKTVILDFWATWCGPCQQAMPQLEKLRSRLNDQEVVVLSLNVLDEKGRFDAWIAKHANTDYRFTFAYDPAGKSPASVASAVYGVEAIPAWFLITPDGKIAAKETGYGGDHNTLIAALRAQNVSIKAED